MPMKADVAIVGAGPVGLYLASLLENEFKIAIVDRSLPGHKTCSGLISTNLDKFVSVPDAIDHVVSQAIVHSPSGKELLLSKKSTAAYVIDRNVFDKALAERISTQITHANVERISTGGRARLETKSDAIVADIVIGCDGATSLVSRSLGQKTGELLAGLIGITKEKNKSDNVDLFFNKHFVKDGFLWKIPRNHSTEYGAMGSGINFSAMESFFNLRSYEGRSAPIPIGLRKTCYDRAILVGDAACHVKPWSGGGIIFGFTAAKIAARVVKKCFDTGNFSEAALMEYERGCKKAFGKEIAFGLMGREMLKDMDNDALDSLFAMAVEQTQHLDMDFPVFSSMG
ncbi:MAG: NAD(P)/FAD-dependent oxidoreductase [Candidatus Aenigmatarchaeota archaeon]